MKTAARIALYLPSLTIVCIFALFAAPFYAWTLAKVYHGLLTKGRKANNPETQAA